MTEIAHSQPQSMTQERNDQLAVEAVRSREALACLYVAHAPGLYRYFWLHTRSQQPAEDLVSETFINVLQALPGYRPERGAFTAWLYGVARRTLAQHFVRVARTPVATSRAGALRAARARAGLPSVSVDERIDLWQAVSELAPGERRAVALKFGAGLTNSEIAESTGLSAVHVGVLLYRALQRLRTRLEEADAQEV
jgi:RNA polymerase sigma factor (sigma-70 family)